MRVSPGSKYDNFRLTSGIEDFRKAKINNFYVRFICFVLKKEVFRLKISMTNSRIMAIVDRLENLLENSSGFPLRKVLFFKYPIKQLSPSALFHRKVNSLIVLKVLKKLDHIRMVLYSQPQNLPKSAKS